MCECDVRVPVRGRGHLEIERVGVKKLSFQGLSRTVQRQVHVANNTRGKYIST